MDRESKLFSKELEIRRELEGWCRAENLLGPGEQLLFSLRIYKRDIVVQDEDDKAPCPTILHISGQSRGKYKGIFERPVSVTPELIGKLLDRVPLSKAHHEFHELLKNGNEPVELTEATAAKVNSAFKRPLEDVYYRLAKGYRGTYQLWVVKPRT